MNPVVDRIDLKILAILQSDGRITNAELSEKVGLSPSPCLNRVRKLEAAGVISRYAAIVNPIALGYEICVFVLVRIDNHTRKAGDDFAAAAARASMIAEAHMISGRLDYLLRVYARNLAHYEEIVRDCISELPHVVSIESLFVINHKEPQIEIAIDASPLAGAARR